MTNAHESGRYLRVRMCVLGEKHERQLHRMVLEAFVGPCPPGMQGCHNDGNRFNNVLENLRWDTSSANALDQFKHGTAAGAKNFKGARGMCNADGTISEAAAKYRHRAKKTDDQRRAASRESTRAYRLRKKLAVTFHDQHKGGAVAV